ncbi:MAG: homoserine kinase [Zetaproteobacteria bacterium]|nr:MAG: homoserine kinase [Zetaproteobacteria bacterium]
MSVYTELSTADVTRILSAYDLGRLIGFEGIADGIENSNFFLDTSGGRYVLTVFERMRAEELPFFMRLMHHLAAAGVPCPDVMPRRDGALLFQYRGKHGCIVSRLPGRTCAVLSADQLRASGAAMAAMHLAGRDFPERRENPTGLTWLARMVEELSARVAQRYGDEARALLLDELHWQQRQVSDDLPYGVIHGDLFVDNILFDGERVTGIIDFYYAHTAPWVMDIAIALNAQALVLGGEDASRMRAFLEGYGSVRPLGPEEHDALPRLLRLSAMRFWVSRLYDAFFPRPGAVTQVKDPEEYRRKLLWHRMAG